MTGPKSKLWLHPPKRKSLGTPNKQTPMDAKRIKHSNSPQKRLFSSPTKSRTPKIQHTESCSN